LGLRRKKGWNTGEDCIIRNFITCTRSMIWAGHVAGVGEIRNAYSILVGKPERKRPLGRPRRRWDDNGS
jgi:hypothetical protein